MFEKPAILFESRTDEIVRNVRELSRLDPEYGFVAWSVSFWPTSHVLCVFLCGSMFLSRTVAAEICMEAKTNETAYAALKRLDKEGVLRFELSYVTALSRVR